MDAREVIVEQLELLGLMVREESGIVPVDATVRADLVDLMARTLVVVFQAKGGRVNERGRSIAKWVCVPPSNACLPVSISCSTQPKLKMSLRESASFP